MGIYTPPGETLGTVIKFTKHIFEKSNGYPNNFWGWGVEDKSLQNRVEYMKIPIVKYLRRNSPNVSDFITVRNDINDRHKDNLFNNKTSFEYNIFNTLTDSMKLKHINSTGLNTLEYKIISKETINENVEIIKVNI